MIPEIIKNHPFTKERLEKEKKWILEEFKKYGINELNYSPSLFNYLSGSPERFFCRNVFQETNIFLNTAYVTNRNIIEKAFLDYKDEISVGISSLSEINKMSFHESSIDFNDIETYYFLDTKLHPTLLKLIEAAYANLILPISVYLRLTREKSLEKLDVFNRVEELKNAKLESLVEQYSNTLRNAIAHGGVKFGAHDVTYVDKIQSISYSKNEVIKMFDRFIDICNGISLGIIVFLHKISPNRECGLKSLIFSLVVQDFIYLLKSPGWRVDKVLESETINTARQLNIFVKNSSMDFNKVNFHSFRTGVLAEKYLSGYDQYFVSIKSKNNKVGWDVLNGSKLKNCRMNKSSELSSYVDVREPGGFFFWQFKLPKIIFKIETLCYAFKIGIDRFWFEWYKHFPKRYQLRTSTIHRSSFYTVVQGSVLLNGFDELKEAKMLKTYVKCICRKIKSEIIKGKSRVSLLRYLPVGYLKINFYKGDFRKRNLGVNGLPPELVCTVSKRSYGQIKEVDIFGGIVEELAGYRIVWNNAYLKSIKFSDKELNERK